MAIILNYWYMECINFWHRENSKVKCKKIINTSKENIKVIYLTKQS